MRFLPSEMLVVEAAFLLIQCPTWSCQDVYLQMPILTHPAFYSSVCQPHRAAQCMNSSNNIQLSFTNNATLSFSRRNILKPKLLKRFYSCQYIYHKFWLSTCWSLMFLSLSGSILVLSCADSSCYDVVNQLSMCVLFPPIIPKPTICSSACDLYCTYAQTTNSFLCLTDTRVFLSKPSVFKKYFVWQI